MGQIKFISLGNTCAVKFNIDVFLKEKNGQATYFFDRIKSYDFKSVCKILSSKNLDDILNLNSINVIPYEGSPSNSKVEFTSFLNCLSVHDVPNEYDENILIKFLEKYKHRRERILDEIKNNNNDIFFIRLGKVTTEEFELFNKIIMEINPECKYKLISLIDTPNSDARNIVNNNFMIINLQKYLCGQIDKSDWKMQYFDWHKVLSDLEMKLQ
jgi:hypothetical protein